MIMKRIFSAVFAVALATVFVGCPTNPGVTPQPPVINDQAKCQAACDHLKALGCEEGQPIDMHTTCRINADCAANQTCSALGTCMVTCVQFCIDTENAGVWLDPGCVASINTCAEINQCPLAKPKTACTSDACPMPGR